jgi:MFS family permease
MARGLALLFAVAGAAGQQPWAQPLLGFITRGLHASTATAGWLVTATQVGYATWILLAVPLGDVFNWHRLVPVMTVCSAALVACAPTPPFGVLFGAITVLGVATAAGQILTPLAGDMASDAHRDRLLGIVVSGLLTRSQSSRSQAAVFGMLETVSRPDRITHPGKAPVNPRPLTISTPLTSTFCMPAASPYSLPAPEGRS